MNSLYTQGVRQTHSLTADLERLRGGDTSAALLGQLSASLAAMQRTIDDYDAMARREIIKAKQEKAQMRLLKFRTDYADLRAQFDILKANAKRDDLLGASTSTSTSTPLSPADPRRRFPAPSTPPDPVSESPFAHAPDPRTAHLLREHSFAQAAEARVDEFLAQGRAALDSLVDQREMLKGTQRRLRDAANTLGLGREVIGWIERRSTQDMYIFWIGAIFTFFCFYLIWRYLG